MPEGSILVIDDDLAVLDTVSEILTFEGYTVAQAANGAEGLQRLDQMQPLVVLLDMRMPVLDGWGFARSVRAQGRTVPIIVMTAAQDAERWAAEINADGYVAKPFALLDLLAAIERVTG